MVSGQIQKKTHIQRRQNSSADVCRHCLNVSRVFRLSLLLYSSGTILNYILLMDEIDGSTENRRHFFECILLYLIWFVSANFYVGKLCQGIPTKITSTKNQGDFRFQTT